MAATSIDTNKVSTYAVQDYSLAYNSCSNSISKCSELYSLLPNDFPQKATVGSIVNNLSTLKSDINSNKEVILSKIKYILSTESNSKSSALLMGKSAEELELEEELRTYGFTEPDIERIMNGEITPEDLKKEIDNDKDPSRRRYMLEAQMLNNSQVSATNMEELKILQEVTKSELEKLIAKKQHSKLETLEIPELLNIIERIQNGEDLEYVINSEIIAWKYVNEEGEECYKYTDPYITGYDGSITYEPITYNQMFKDSKYLKELKTITEKVEVNRMLVSSTPKELIDFLEKLNNENANINTAMEELDKSIEEKNMELNTYLYLENYITEEVDNYINNIDPYVRNENFEKNSVMNEKEVLDTLNKIDQRYTEGLELLGSTYACVVGDNKEELMQIFSYIINGKNEKGDVGNLYIPSSDRKIAVYYNDPIIANFQKWQGHMSEDEIKVFNYIYNTQSADEAYAYLENISKTLDSRWVVAKTREDQEYATEHPVAASIASIFITPVEGIFAGISSLNYKIHGGELYRSDVYSSGAVLRAAVSENIGEKTQVGKFFYDAGMSMADSLVLVGATAVTGGSSIPFLSTTWMGTRAYVSTLNDALDRGIDTDKAILLATTSAAVETLAESYSLGHLMNLEGKMGKYVSDLTTKVAQKFSDPVMAKAASKLVYIGGGLISQGLAEAEEEVATEILNNFADEVISGELSNFSLAIKNYIKLGFTEEEATNMAISDNIEQLAIVFASSFVSGGVMGGASAGISSYNISRSINQEMLNQYNGNSALAFADIVSYNTNIARLETELNKILTKQKLREIGNKVKYFLKKNNSNGNFSIINSELDPVISDFEQAYELYFRGGLANMLVTTEKGENGKISGYSLFSSLDYAGGPTLVSSEEFENLSSKSQYGTLVRGVSGPLAVQHASQFKTGDLYVDSISSSPRGTGVYAAYGIDSTNVKQNYASNSGTTSGQVLEMTLSQDAKVIDYKTVSSEQAKVLDIMARKFTKYDSAIVDFDTLCVNLDKITDVNAKNEAKFITNVLSDIGYYAALKGYDAIVDSDTGYFNILNRGKVYVKEVKQLNTSSNLSKYTELVNQAKQILQDINPIMVELYEKAAAMGKSISEFLGYEEHNFVHVTRVADTSVAILTELEKMIKSGSIKAYGSISPDIVYLAGLAHDLGMRYEKGESYRLNNDGEFVLIDVPDDTVIRKSHPINSAITVLKNRQVFGENSEMIACLAYVHSKSSSKVQNISSIDQLSKMVMNLYNNQERCGYEFDISKIGTLETITNENGETVTTLNFNTDVLKQFKTGAVALRIGDAHAAKTGFNHGGGELSIEKYPGEIVTTENFRTDIDELCSLEASDSIINVKFPDKTVPLKGGKLDFSKQVVIGERNAQTLDSEFRNGILVHKMRVLSELNPASTWARGIEEKFGEYRTFIDIPQVVEIELPADASPNTSLFYQEFILKYIYQNKANGVKTIILKQGDNQFQYDIESVSEIFNERKKGYDPLVSKLFDSTFLEEETIKIDGTETKDELFDKLEIIENNNQEFDLPFLDDMNPQDVFNYFVKNIEKINVLAKTKQFQEFIEKYYAKNVALFTYNFIEYLSRENLTSQLIDTILSFNDEQFVEFISKNPNSILYENEEIFNRAISTGRFFLAGLSDNIILKIITNEQYINNMKSNEKLADNTVISLPSNLIEKFDFKIFPAEQQFLLLKKYFYYKKEITGYKEEIDADLQKRLIQNTDIIENYSLLKQRDFISFLLEIKDPNYLYEILMNNQNIFNIINKNSSDYFDYKFLFKFTSEQQVNIIEKYKMLDNMLSRENKESMMSFNYYYQLENFFKVLNPNTIEYFIEKNSQLIYNLSINAIVNLVNNLPNTKILQTDTSLMETVLEKYDQYMLNGGTNIYGADQNATGRFMEIAVKNLDWLETEELFREYLISNCKFSKESAEEWIEFLNSGENIKISHYAWYVISNYIINNCLQQNIYSYNDIMDNTFSYSYNEYFNRLLDKLTNQGMNTEDSIRVLSAINTTGICSYAAYANEILLAYKGQEELFEKQFGYPMYTEINGHQEFNFSELLLDMYLYINSDLNGGSLFKYDNSNNSYQIADLNTSKQLYLNQSKDYVNNFFKSKGLDIKFVTINELNSKSIEPNSTISLQSVKEIANIVQKYLSAGKGSIYLSIRRKTGKKYRFIDSNMNTYMTTDDWNEGGGHGVCITGVTNKHFIVSSWGKRTLIPFEDFVDNNFEFNFRYLEGVE